MGLVMSNSLKKLAAVGFLLLVALWLAGIARTYFLPEPEPFTFPTVISFSSADYRSGARTAHNLAQIDLAKDPLPKMLDQADINQIRVYEKTAELSAGSTAFGEDEARTRNAIGTHKAVIFSEKSTGIVPERSLALGISVHPDRFDALLQEISHIGQLSAINVQQHDRTGEFRRLHAQRQSLKKHQEAIVKLLANSMLSVEEALKLEQKVLEIEKEMQPLGAQLGDFLGQEPSYNLLLTLQEQVPGSRHDRSYTFARRLGTGFYWAIGWWLVGAIGISFLVGTVMSIKILWPSSWTIGSKIPSDRS
jgi:hypothetical protein